MGKAVQGIAEDVGTDRPRSLFERQHPVPSPVVAFEEAPVLVPSCAVSSSAERRGSIDPGPRRSFLLRGPRRVWVCSSVTRPSPLTLAEVPRRVPARSWSPGRRGCAPAAAPTSCLAAPKGEEIVLLSSDRGASPSVTEEEMVR
jgi:hypothetical protein